MDADYFVLLAVLLAVSVNRHSLIFLCVFALSELPHHLNTNPIYDNVVMAITFAATAFVCKHIKWQLQIALCCYAALFWCSAFDFLLTAQETIFYVIFPYVVKLIDIYVIYHLIHKEQGCDRYNSTNRCTFN